MKYLTDYTNEPINKLLEENKAFFAFSHEQFEKAKDKDILKDDYCHIKMGLYAPKVNAKNVLLGLIEINKKGIEDDIAENGLINIIKRELNNHECYYTGDIEQAVEVLESYDINREQVQKVFRNKNTTIEELQAIK
jgi:hypothetical protein